MNRANLLGQLWPYVNRYWFRIGLVLVVLFVLTRKDFSFTIRFGGGQKQEQPVQEQVSSPALEQRQTLTEATITEKPSILERLNIFGGSGSSSAGALLQQLESSEEGRVKEFIRRFSNVAQAEQEKYGVPASIILASSLLYSQAGAQAAATQHNNFFKLPCSVDWRGPEARVGSDCVRVYDNAWTSFRDHSLYVTTGSMAHLSRLGKTDYQQWAKGLEQAGFGNTDNVAAQLLAVIDRYQLTQFD